MESLKIFKTFDDFWPHYMREYLNPSKKWLHIVEVAILHLIFLYIFATADFMKLLFVPLVYALSWAAHLGIEKKSPIAFKHPLWTVMGNFKMFYLVIFKKI